jgi:subtilisin family serine protease
MKIRFLSDTYIRPTPSATGSEPIGIAFAGAVIEAMPIQGEAIEGVSLWYADANGWCYWAGMTEIVPEKPLPPPADTALQAEPAPPPADEPAAPPEPPPVKRRKAPEPPPTEPIAAPDPAQLNWALTLHRIPEDWWARGLRGNGVRLALLGTGALANHPDLRHLADTCAFPSRSSDVSDANGLGIQCAVTAAGAGTLLYGVAPEAQLLIGKVGDQPLLIAPDDFISGLEWALEKDAHVILTLAELPVLTPAQREKLQHLIEVALARGVPLVAPVGTTLSNRPVQRYPAALDGVLAVGAHDAFEKRCAFSAVSLQLDLLAPGTGLNYSLPGKPALPVSRSTAIAAAYVAGVAVLAVQALRAQGIAPDAQALYQTLRRTAIVKSPYEHAMDPEYGAGLLWPPALLQALQTA